MTEQRWPWEVEPLQEKKHAFSLEAYVAFMDTHVRVRAFKNGEKVGTFSVLSDGTELGAEITLDNGAAFKIVVIGHPVTTDPMMTPEELANYLLTK